MAGTYGLPCSAASSLAREETQREFDSRSFKFFGMNLNTTLPALGPQRLVPPAAVQVRVEFHLGQGPAPGPVLIGHPRRLGHKVMMDSS